MRVLRRTVRLTIPQSLTLDGVYVVLVGGAWLAAPERPDPGAPWKIVAAAAGPLAAVLAVASWRRARRGELPLLNRSPIRQGEPWRSEWLGHPERCRLAPGEHVVAFLSMDCSQCHTWMGLLRNAVHPHPELPQVLGVFDLPPDKLSDLQEILGIPLTALGSSWKARRRRWRCRRLRWGWSARSRSRWATRSRRTPSSPSWRSRKRARPPRCLGVTLTSRP